TARANVIYQSRTRGDVGPRDTVKLSDSRSARSLALPPYESIRSLLRHDVGVARDLLPASTLFHPYSRKPETLGFSGIRHLPAPHHHLAARQDRRVAIEAEILNLPVVGCDHQEAGSDHPRT